MQPDFTSEMPVLQRPVHRQSPPLTVQQKLAAYRKTTALFCHAGRRKADFRIAVGVQHILLNVPLDFGPMVCRQRAWLITPVALRTNHPNAARIEARRHRRHRIGRIGRVSFCQLNHTFVNDELKIVRDARKQALFERENVAGC